MNDHKNSSSKGMLLNQKLKKGHWVVLFYAEWCGHCQAMKPEWEKFKSQSQGKKYNVDEIESSEMVDLDEQFKANVQGFPTIVFIDKGKLKSVHSGDRTVDSLDEFANNSLPKGKALNINSLLKKNLKTKSKKTKKSKSKSKNKTKTKHQKKHN
jgi:thioredoxin-like negative regulator of GroEL